MATPPPQDAIAPSVLGTKEHWDTTYGAELAAYRADGTPGEEWFDDRLSPDRLTAFLARLLPPAPAPAGVVDVGCGSGGVLVALAAALAGRAPRPRLVGVDYAADGVALAAACAAAEGVGGEGGPSFSVCDVLAPGALAGAAAPCGDASLLVHDKGTLDAFLLRPDADVAVGTYIAAVGGVTRPGDLLVVTSCNLSRAQLVDTVTGGEAGGGGAGGSAWMVADELAYKTMRFGGQEGAHLVTLAFKRL